MRVSPWATFGGGVALLLPLLTHPSLLLSPFTLRYAALAIVLTVGLTAAINLLRSPARRPALLALAFAGWALISAAASPSPALALWGLFGLGTGALFICALVGAWGIGASGGDDGRALIERAIIATGIANAVVAVLQTLFDLTALDLPLYSAERAPGLLGNPVFLGGLLAGALWPVLHRVIRGWGWSLVVLLFGAALQLSGSRYSLALAFVTVAAAAVTRRLKPGAMALAGAALLLGVLAGAGVSDLRGSQTGTERAFDQPIYSGGVSKRVDAWRAAPAAIAERPMLGFGPNRYSEATSPRRTQQLAQDRPETLFTDAHNLIVEYGVTTGLPGLALLVGLLVSTFRRAGVVSPLAGFALLVLLGHLVQPQNVALTPLAFLAAGAAMNEGRAPPLPRYVGIGAAAVGAAAAAVCIYGAFLLEQSRLDTVPGPAMDALEILPPWPEPAELIADAYAFAGVSGPTNDEMLDRSRAWQLIAARRDPADPALWNSLAEAELRDGLRKEAGRHFRTALQLNPWSVRAMNGLGHLARQAGETQEALDQYRRSLLVHPLQRDIKGLVQDLERRADRPAIET